MICQNCNERPATVHLTQIINDEHSETHLCEECAHNVDSEIGFLLEPGFTFQDLISGLLEGSNNGPHLPGGAEPYCNSCGLTFSDFRNNGLLGCGDCYNSFKNGLEPLLKKVQGSTRHAGKVPKRTGGKVRVRKEIEEMRLQLQQAIGREDYETAARLRDEIRDYETEL
jgi:protein arginine kinase activator